MQYDAKTPSEYLGMLDDDWRKKQLQALRVMLMKHDPDLVEGINYKMLSYSDRRGIVCSLNAQKNFVALYFGDVKKIDPDGSLLTGIEQGKGCLRFKKSVPVSSTRVDEFIARAMRIRKSGGDIEC